MGILLINKTELVRQAHEEFLCQPTGCQPYGTAGSMSCRPIGCRPIAPFPVIK